MVAANESYAIGVSNFKTEKQEEGFKGVEATVDKVTWSMVSVECLYMHGGDSHP